MALLKARNGPLYLQAIGAELRSMATPTFHNLIQAVAPPISTHERLQIHITHDLVNYPSLEPTIYEAFDRVMQQVEGGDLMVIQRGQEQAPKRISGETSWRQGPWWRSGGDRNINAVKGVRAGTKLARAAAEGYADDYFASKGGVEMAAKRATESLSETNPVRDSQIFFAVQAIIQEASKELFEAEMKDEKEGQIKESDDTNEEVIFAMYLHDPIHGIAFHIISQALPRQWVDWVDATAGENGAPPESIQEIMESGGVDPREWVSEWVEETVSLGMGVVAQRYVARRMGVGEGGAAKGKDKLRADKSTQEMVESGGGEAARALGGM